MVILETLYKNMKAIYLFINIWIETGFFLKKILRKIFYKYTQGRS